VCSFVFCVSFERDVLFCVICVICVLYLIVVPLPPGKIPFAVKINNNNIILGGHSNCHSEQCICTCVLFRTVSEIELFHCTVPKLLIRKRYYVMFLIPVFSVQVTKLVQFTQYNTFPSSAQCRVQYCAVK
jgi:hypothetical protein